METAVSSMGRAPSYHSGMSYTELWNSLHSVYHPMPSSYMSDSLSGDHIRRQFPEPASAVGTSIATTETSGVSMKFCGSQMSNDSYMSEGSSSSAGSNSTSNANKQETQPPPGKASQDRPEPPVKVGAMTDATGTKNLTRLHPIQPPLEQNRFMMQMQPSFDRDRYSFDPRRVDPKLYQDREWLTVTADSDAADTLLSMKRSAVVHLNADLFPKNPPLHHLRGRDNYHTVSMMPGGPYYGDYCEENPVIRQAGKKELLQRHEDDLLLSDGRKDSSRDASYLWHWRHQEVKRILSSDEGYEPQPSTAANESTSESAAVHQSMDYHVMESYQPSTGYANDNLKTLSAHYKTGEVGGNFSDFVPSARYYARSNGDGTPSDIPTALWNVNAPLSMPSQQPYAVAVGCASGSPGWPVTKTSWGGSLAENNQEKKGNGDVNSNIASQSHQCKICGKTCTRPSSLRTHMRSHYGEKPYLCQLCGKTFTQASNLRAHVRIHSGEKPFKCGVCHRTFSQSSSEKTHMRTHTGERPYTCVFCSKSFSDSSTLSNHRRTHTGEKPYQCQICCRPFSQSGNLNRHMRIHQRKWTGQSAMEARAKSSA